MSRSLAAVQTSSAQLGANLVKSVLSGIQSKTPSLGAQLAQGIRSAIATAKSSVSSISSDLGNTVGNSIQSGASKAIAGLSDSPLGKQLAAVSSQIAANQNAEQLASLKQSLAQAQTPDATTGVVDPVAVQQAQQALSDWQLQQQQTTLQAQYDAQATQIQKTADLQASGFQQGLADLNTALGKGLIDQKTYDGQLKTLLANSGQDYTTIGTNLGYSFAVGFVDQLKTLGQQVSTIFAGPNALSAAQSYASLQTALGSIGGSAGGKVKITGLGGGGVGVHGFADGALVKGGRGGVLAMVGEGSHDELVTPLDNGRVPGGDTYIVNLHVAGTVVSQDNLMEAVHMGLTRRARNGTGTQAFRQTFA